MNTLSSARRPRQCKAALIALVILSLVLPGRSVVAATAALGGVDASPSVVPTYTFIAPVEQDTSITTDNATPWGAEKRLYILQNGGSTSVWSTLMQFDLSVIPLGSQVVSAKARLYVRATDSTPINVHRVTAAWDERVATWAAVGSHYDPLPTTSFVPAGRDQATQVDLTSLAQDWLAGVAPNHGILLETPLPSSDHTLASKEESDGAQWPYLEVLVANPRLMTIKDDFDPNTGYAGSDGNRPWRGPWMEIAEADGPAIGQVQARIDDKCGVAACLQVAGLRRDAIRYGAQRGADLAGAVSAALSFTFRTTERSGRVDLEISSDGGQQWSRLRSYGAAVVASSHVSQTFNILPFVSPDTRIRFIASGDPSDLWVYVDDVQLAIVRQGIAGRVWGDVNRDAMLNAGEAGLPGVALALYAGACASATSVPYRAAATTNEGKYIFAQLPAGDYCVRPDRLTLPISATLTTSSPALDVTLTADKFISTIDFGYALTESPDRLNVGAFAPCTDPVWLRQLAQDYHTTLVAENPAACLFTASGAAADIAALQAAVAAHPNSRHVALDALARGDFTPDDPDFSNPSRVYGPQQIHAPAAWDVTLGDPNLIIAIVDTGVDPNHPEFAGRLLPGYDFVNNDADPRDDNGHGTHVAGIAAAAINNATGIAGIAGTAQILPVKVLNASNVGTWSQIAQGITYAVDHGAKIINLSLGGATYSAAIVDALNYALSHNVTVVAAAGNDSTAEVRYPASLDQVLALGATTVDGVRWSLSNYGQNVDAMAPGATLYSTYWASTTGSGYRFMSGTSMAAPHASGLAALLLTVNPSLTPVQVKDLLQSTATDLGDPGVDVLHGYGLLNAEAALAATPAGAAITPTTSLAATLAHDANANGLVEPGDTVRYLVTVANPSPLGLPNVVVSATTPLYTSYVPASGRLSGIPVQDNSAPASPFPLDEGGLNIGTLLAGASVALTFDVVISQPSRGVYALVGDATVTAGGAPQVFQATTPVAGTLLQAAVSQASAQISQTLAYTFTTDYLGSALLSNVVVTAAAPSGTSYVAGSANAGGVLGGGGEAPPLLQWNLGSNIQGIAASVLTPLGSATVLIEPSADTYIDSDAPDTNFGAAARMLVHKQGGREAWSLAWFDLSAIPTSRNIITATLELELVSPSDTSDLGVDAYESTQAWNENTVTWGSFGQRRSATPETGTTVADLGIYRWDLTAVARAWHSGARANRGIVLSTAVNSPLKYFATRENISAMRPRLRVFYASEASPVAQADTYLDSSAPDTNFGSQPVLLVDDLGNKPFWSLLRFDMASIPPSAEIILARLRLALTSASFTTPAWIHAYQGTTPWNEATVTWRNYSDGRGNLLDTTAVRDLGSYTWNITPAVQGWKANSASNNGLVLSLDPTQNNQAKWFAAREHADATRRPTAVMAYALPQASLGSVSAANPTLATAGSLITVTQFYSASRAIDNVSPTTLVITGTNGVTASLVSGPTPVSATVGVTGTTFTWVYQVTGNAIGQLTFGGGAAGGGYVWPAAQSNSVIVHPPLTFQATVNSAPPSGGPLRTTAFIRDAGGVTPPLPAASNTAATALFAALGDRIWHDYDGDAIQDPGEPGLTNVTVCLAPAVVTPSCAATDITGEYLFAGVPPGVYTVTVAPASLPPDFVYVTTFHPLVVTVHDGQSYTAADFGFKTHGAVIGDALWYDADADGLPDPGEPGLGNVTLALWLDDGDLSFEPAPGLGADTFVAATVSDAAGAYRFDVPIPGVYFVDVTDDYGLLAGLAHTTAGWSLPDPSPPIPVINGQVFSNADFGYVRVPSATYGVVGDLVWADANTDGSRQPHEAALVGVTVCATPAGGGAPTCAATDANGHYRLTLPAGTYQVAPTSPIAGLVPAGAGYLLLDLLPAAQALSVDFSFVADGIPLGAVGGAVWQDLPVNDDTDGVFDSTREPGIPEVSLGLIQDPNANGLWEPGEPYLATFTTLDGDYLFTGLPGGRYLVRVTDSRRVLRRFGPARPGPLAAAGADHQSKAQPYPVALAPGGIDTTADFGYFEYDAVGLNEPPEPGLIGNLVWIDLDADGLYRPDQGDLPAPGVTLAIYDAAAALIANATTDLAGRYLFSDLPLADYTVRVSDEFGVLSAFIPTVIPTSGADDVNRPQPYPVSLGLVTSDFTADFGYAPPAALAGFAFVDQNGNQSQDPGETWGLSDVAVTLTDLDRATTVSVQTLGGVFAFQRLLPGAYRVEAASHLGSLLITSDPVVTLTLTAGQTLDTLRFGYVAPTASPLAAFSARSGADGVRVAWAVDAETAEGWRVWRSAPADGPAKPVSPFLPARAGAAAAAYDWLDALAAPGGAYWYTLERLPDGARFGPIQAQPAEIPRLFLPLLPR